MHGWSLETHGVPILHDVHRLLGPQFSGVRAQLYKLNVYRPGELAMGVCAMQRCG